MWSAVAMLVAVFAPVILWTQWNDSLSGEETLPAGERIVLTATPPPMAPTAKGRVELTIPGDGWATNVDDGKSDHTRLVHNTVVVDVTAVAGVEDIEVLFERQIRDRADGNPPMFTTGSHDYTSPTKLNGLWGDLTGEGYSGALIVLGRETVAVVLTVTAPLGRLDNELDGITTILADLKVLSS
jgi:hypothetical protein